jgi:signal transduction histidine kinase
MPLQRYDVRDRSGEFVERYWTPINSPAISADGTVLAVVHRVEDVTRLVLEGEALWEQSARLNEKLELRAHELALANALRDEVEQRRRVAAIVAHDLRSPLSTISTGLHVLSMQFRSLGATPPHTVELVRGAAARMEHMLNDLDDYWRSELRGVLPVARQWADVRSICDEVVRALQVTYPARTLDLERGDDFGASVDPMRIRQLLTNLLNNAITYGAPDRPVRVAVQRVTGGFVIAVTNEGKPIPERIIPMLFEPFQRGPGTDGARQRGHMGLGLFIVQQIVRAHGGKISVESTPGRTCFTVFVPIP